MDRAEIALVAFFTAVTVIYLQRGHYHLNMPKRMAIPRTPPPMPDLTDFNISSILDLRDPSALSDDGFGKLLRRAEISPRFVIDSLLKVSICFFVMVLVLGLLVTYFKLAMLVEREIQAMYLQSAAIIAEPEKCHVGLQDLTELLSANQKKLDERIQTLVKDFSTNPARQQAAPEQATRLELLEAEHNKLRNQLDTSLEASSAIQRLEQTLPDQQETLRTQEGTLKERTDALAESLKTASTIADLELETAEQKVLIESQVKKLTEQKSLLAKNAKVSSDLAASVINMNDQADLLRTEIKTLNNQLSAAQRDAVDLERKIKANDSLIEFQRGKHVAKVEDLNEDVTFLEEKLAEQREQLDTQREDLLQMEKNLTAVKAHSAHKDDLLAERGALLEEKEAVIKAFKETSSGDLQRAVADFSQEKNNMKEKYDAKLELRTARIAELEFAATKNEGEKKVLKTLLDNAVKRSTPLIKISPAEDADASCDSAAVGPSPEVKSHSAEATEAPTPTASTVYPVHKTEESSGSDSESSVEWKTSDTNTGYGFGGKSRASSSKGGPFQPTKSSSASEDVDGSGEDAVVGAGISSIAGRSSAAGFPNAAGIRKKKYGQRRTSAQKAAAKRITAVRAAVAAADSSSDSAPAPAPYDASSPAAYDPFSPTAGLPASFWNPARVDALHPTPAIKDFKSERNPIVQNSTAPPAETSSGPLLLGINDSKWSSGRKVVANKARGPPAKTGTAAPNPNRLNLSTTAFTPTAPDFKPNANSATPSSQPGSAGAEGPYSSTGGNAPTSLAPKPISVAPASNALGPSATTNPTGPATNPSGSAESSSQPGRRQGASYTKPSGTASNPTSSKRPGIMGESKWAH